MTNSLSIWPASPMPVLAREIDWGETDTMFQTGRAQTSTALSQPLMRWNIPFTNVMSADRRQIYNFYMNMKGPVGRFLMMDPDDFHVASAGISFITGVNTFLGRNEFGHRVIPASGHINIVTVLSGTLTNGIDYTLDQDTGIMTYVLTPSATDSWSVQSTDFFRKCKFAGGYQDASPRVWSTFNITVKVEEVTI